MTNKRATPKNILTHLDEVLNHVSYDYKTGNFKWIIRKGKKKPGECAGSANAGGYIIIVINRKIFPAHRLAWAIHYKEEPPETIDHINHDPSDNRIENIRKATNQENCKNQSRRNNNASGSLGVYWHKTAKMWYAQIRVDGELIHIGNFKEKEDAIEARKKANAAHGFHENHGICQL
jgi:hypothetical protein